MMLDAGIRPLTRPWILSVWVGGETIMQVGLTQHRLDDPNPDTHVQPVFVLKNDGGKRAGGHVNGGGERERSGRREAGDEGVAASLRWETILEPS